MNTKKKILVLLIAAAAVLAVIIITNLIFSPHGGQSAAYIGTSQAAFAAGGFPSANASLVQRPL